MAEGSREPVRIGTRGSPLALWQAGWVASQLAALRPGLRSEIVRVRTLAEKFPEREIAEIGSGVFTRELDEALRKGEVDIAVHSMKDVPTELGDDLRIAAVPARESPLDAFISPSGIRLETIPRGARIATGSPRRKAQLLHHRPDLEIVPIRGNVGTRIRKMEELGCSGTILAHAGLRRLGEEARITHLLDPVVIVPAVSQGALAVIVLAGAPARGVGDLADIWARLDHPESRRQVEAERGFLRRLRGGCQVPAGALAETAPGDTLRIRGVIAAPGGEPCLRGEVSGPSREAEALGVRLADELLGRGGKAVLDGIRGG